MNRLQKLRESYAREINRPWSNALAGPQKVWFAVYPMREEKTLRASIPDWGLLTKKTQERGFYEHDLTGEFASWISELPVEYQTTFWSEPHQLDLPMQALFPKFLEERLRSTLGMAGEQDVVALYGAASLFGLASVSALIEATNSSISGRLLVFFPGERDESVYRLLGARDGWNYHALPL